MNRSIKKFKLLLLLLFAFLFIYFLVNSFWAVRIGIIRENKATCRLSRSEDFSVHFPEEKHLKGYAYDIPNEFPFLDCEFINDDVKYIPNENLKYILIVDEKKRKKEGYFLNLKRKNIYMTHPLSICNAIKDNTIAIVDRLALEVPLHPLMALQADYSENDNTMVFYVTRAAEDNGYNGKPIAPKLLLYHKTIEITKVK